MKMESELEKVQLEVKGALYELNIEQLLNLCNALQVIELGKEQIKDKSRSQLITLVSNYVDKVELAELEDGGMSHLLNMKDLIENATMPELEPAEEDKEKEGLQKEVNALRDTLKAKEEAIHQLVNKKLSLQSTPKQRCVSSPQDNTMWRKDFKVSGQIGEPGQKDKLTFSSLARQIESGLSKGFCEMEIIDAVIRAITPGLQLRSYLEGKCDLTLPALRRILRSHFQERGATELYKQLSSEVQSSKETPQNFLLRAMDLRQKILFASQEDESGLKYDPALVQSLFMHTILTGLQSDSVKSDMQPYLQPTTSDEVLLEKVNIACANEKERQDKKKHTVPQRAAAVNTVQPSDTPVSAEKKTVQMQSIAAPSPDLLSEIKEMRSEMVFLKDLRAEVSQIRETMQKSTAQAQPSTYGGPADYYPAPTSTPYPQYQLNPSAQLYHPQHSPGALQQRPLAALQPYYPAPGPAPVRGRAQFQQRFAPQRYFMPRPRPMCSNCIEAGEEYCHHCFRCGSSDHFRAGCRLPRPAKSTGGTPLN